MKKFLLVLLSMLSFASDAQVLNSKFDTKNHPKAKGVWATIRYPTGWQAKEGERPNIVQKFSGDYNDMFVVLSLQILDAGAPVEKECSDMSIAEFAEAFSDKASNQIVTNVKKSTHEEKPAFLYDMRGTYERAGMSIVTSNRVMTVCYKRNLISAWCSPSTFDRAKQSISSGSQQLIAANSLCFQFFNSLVLMDKY
jgi:hypothetical protein